MTITIFRCLECDHDRDRDDADVAPCRSCGVCGICAPTSGGSGGSDLCERCDPELEHCRCGVVLPSVAEDEVPFEFCSQECKDEAREGSL